MYATSNTVTETMAGYPEKAQQHLKALRLLIYRVAQENPSLGGVSESLKWGELSYCTPKGSPIRIDWKAKAPDRVSIFFNCQSQLVPTFKAIFGNKLSYEKPRAIHLPLAEPLPETILTSCIKTALQYHAVKQLPLLGL